MKLDDDLLVRSCGECSACCTALKVPELGKGEREPCVHAKQIVGTRRCLVYENRPDSCRKFRCAWLDGVGPVAARPDKTDIILVLTESKFGPTVQAFEMRDNAHLRPTNAEVIERLVRKGIVVVIFKTDGTRRLLGPPSVVAKIQAMVKAQEPIDE